MKVLVGDIGGTNTRFLYVDYNGNTFQSLAEASYASQDYDEFSHVLNAFSAEHALNGNIDAACFAVAGPVKQGVASVTNLPWALDEIQLSKQFDIPRVKLINDFEAVGYGISELSAADFLTLQQGVTPGSDHPGAAIIGAGTGLGVAHRVWLHDHYYILSSETGHTAFAPETKAQTELLGWLQQRYSHVSLELLLSGRGLSTIYQFLLEVAGMSESAKVNNAMQKTDPAQVITQHALAGSDQLCSKTLQMFIDIYAAAAGDVALHYYPVDEVYIAGGIAQKIQQQMSGQRFSEVFCNKGLMQENMQAITVKLVTQEKVGLYGALSRLR